VGVATVARRRVVVVGAGAAGLTAAGALGEDHEVVVVDKARGVGGRMATRRIAGATFDHGAQFFTTHSPEFARTVAGWQEAGVARVWYRGRVGPHGLADADGHERYRGDATMTAVARHLAVGLDVRLGVRLTSAQVAARRWRLHAESGEVFDADAVVLTPPVPQSLGLLASGGVDLEPAVADALGAIRYDPCLAVLAPLRGPSGLPTPGALDPDSGPIDWLADNQVKGVSAAPGVTIHATAGCSRALEAAGDGEVVDALLGEAGLRSDPVLDEVQVQRWRYAKPTVLHPDRCLAVASPAPFVCAGDAFGGAKVEGAVLSGVEAATAVRRLLADPRSRA
jgi:renalase